MNSEDIIPGKLYALEIFSENKWPNWIACLDEYEFEVYLDFEENIKNCFLVVSKSCSKNYKNNSIINFFFKNKIYSIYARQVLKEIKKPSDIIVIPT